MQLTAQSRKAYVQYNELLAHIDATRHREAQCRRGYRDAEMDEWRCGLYAFVKYFWHILEPETPFVSGWPLEAICDHLEAITFHTDQKEPWRAFLALGRKLCQYEDMRSTRDDPELYSIYRLLNGALRHARQVAYFHIRGLYGKAYATRLLPEVKGCPHEDVISLAFNT